MPRYLGPLLLLVFTSSASPALAAPQAQTRAITGNPSSALHCVTGAAANVHPLGWLAAGGGYTITFDSDVPLTTLIVRVEVSEGRVTVVRGAPDFNFNASTSGMMVLYVSGNGQPACYRFQALVDPPAGAAGRFAAEPPSPAPARADAPSLFASRAIAGTASSAQYCVGAGMQTPIVHDLGRVDRDSTIGVTFAADFDAVAAATALSLEPGATVSLAIDDNSGGNGVPSLSFRATAGQNIVLFVSGNGEATGCYRYQVQVR